MTDETPLESTFRRWELTSIEQSIAALATRVGALSEQMAVQTDRHSQVCSQLFEMKEEIAATHKEITEVKEYADRWKGGFYAVTGLGACIVGIITIWDKIPKPWGH